ncbi:UvrB/UvrC motif-containing protein [Falsibacillus pallidus]|uniref:Protein arginine kinase activator n=1 Tax=Falsibacillus pallidus TaxID=493781 RepID=A0A370G756_9BACI|nr:UvrB/UvrC motif-containing protein [Falsibacillus pallidus]RDI39040.1 protein arginine kinase activator [Falsibacillus pallidus]
MICQECNERPATLHFTKIINGQKTEFHLCEKCAQDKGESFLFGDSSGFSINNLLAGLFSSDNIFQKEKQTLPKNEVVQCERCSMTLPQFINIGRFGCPNCYHAFRNHLDSILKRLHSGNTAHHGKIPERMGGSIHTKKQIHVLKEEMKAFIETEEFEKAAELRDEIRSLEKSLKQGGESS